MNKEIIKAIVVIFIVTLIVIGMPIVYKSKMVVKEDKYEILERNYEDVIISLMQTKKIGIYLKGDIIMKKNETGEEKVIPEGIINNITDYEEVQYFVNLINDCPLITHEINSTLMPTSERLYLYDENDKELMRIEVDGSVIDIWKGDNYYHLENKHQAKINEFLEKYINYEF
ncbi:MAG: hypothetical protein NC483_05400 [Ruminococcus sp.]|nr:hypothetical protein [Ruminococcus sp.]